MSGGNVDGYSVEAFKKEMRNVVEERRLLGEIMPPGGTLLLHSPNRNETKTKLLPCQRQFGSQCRTNEFTRKHKIL